MDNSPRKKIFGNMNLEKIRTQQTPKNKFKFDFSWAISPHPEKIWKGG